MYIGLQSTPPLDFEKKLSSFQTKQWELCTLDWNCPALNKYSHIDQKKDLPSPACLIFVCLRLKFEMLKMRLAQKYLPNICSINIFVVNIMCHFIPVVNLIAHHKIIQVRSTIHTLVGHQLANRLIFFRYYNILQCFSLFEIPLQF